MIFFLLFNFLLNVLFFADCVFIVSYRDYRSFGVFLSGTFIVKGIVVFLGWVSACALICIKHELSVFLCVCKDGRIHMLCVCMCTSTCVGVNMYFFNANACVCACVYLCWWHVDRETKGWGGPMLQYFFLPLPKSLRLCYANARKSRRFKVPRFQDFFFVPFSRTKWWGIVIVLNVWYFLANKALLCRNWICNHHNLHFLDATYTTHYHSTDLLYRVGEISAMYAILIYSRHYYCLQ